jgi:hypothetical protein
MDKIKIRNKILAFTNRFTSWHEKIFMYLARKSKTSLWFTALLLFICIYEIVEHFIIPALLLWWGLK